MCRSGTLMKQWWSGIVAVATLVACGGQGALPRGDEIAAPPTADVTAMPAADESQASRDDDSVSAPPAPTGPSTPLAAELLISGFKLSGASGPHAFTVLREREQVLGHWQSAIGDADAPLDARLDLDFSSNVIIFADLGQQPDIWKYFTGAAARQYEDRVEVELIVGVNGNDCGRAAALSYPYAFVRVAASDLPYVGVEREDLPDCE
jgi:hypothetical protein